MTSSDSPENGFRPSVSVLIPVYNGEDTIARCVESVLAQDYPDFEVVVVNDCSSDDTGRILDAYAERATVLTNQRNSGIARTYNRALAESRGEVVVMLASDCALRSPDYLTRLLRHFDDASVGAVAGKAIIEDFDRAPAIHRIFARLNILDVNNDETGTHEVNFVEVRCDGFRRSVLEELGGLNEDLFRSNEDQDLSIRIVRLGYRLLQDDSLEFDLGFGGTEDTLGKLLSKQSQYARGQAYITVNYGVGSSDGLWENPNRRARAAHRMSQVASLPILVALGLSGTLWSPALWGIPLLLIQRLWHYYGLAGDLRSIERLAALPLGLCSDAIYSVAFIGSAIGWVLSGKSVMSAGRRAHGHGPRASK